MQGPAGIFGSAILEVAVGLMFLYFLLSTICSTINEILAGLLKWRAQHLEKALGNLITDPDLLARIVNHPLIRSMGPRDSPERGKPRAGRDLEGKPSYIPSRTFTLALLHELAAGQVPTTTTAPPDVSVTVSSVCAAIRKMATQSQTEGQLLTGRALRALMESSRDPAALAQRLESLKQTLGSLPREADMPDLQLALAPMQTLDEIDAFIHALPDSALRTATLGLVESARRDIDEATYNLDQLRTHIEAWFDNAMERLSGAYKRWAMCWLAGIGLVLTLLTGADSIHFVTRLYTDAVFRSQIAAQAAAQTQAQPSADLSQAVNALEPLGSLFGYADLVQGPSDGPSTALRVLSKIVGEVLTVLALLLGAPFWFDLLQKAVNLRSAGPPPPSTIADNDSRRQGRE